MSNKSSIIEAKNICKSFGSFNALSALSFSVFEGEIFGLLGPNGAGKTTTINILTGLTGKDEGELYISGKDCKSGVMHVQHLMGIVPDDSNLYPEMTALENLIFCAALYGVKNLPQSQEQRSFLWISGFLCLRIKNSVAFPRE
jgi:ABC-2 type transport system ATP-binding protein